MIAALESAISVARAMNPREFNAAKCRAHPSIIARLHGDGRGRLLAVDRDYKPIGCRSRGHVAYDAPDFAHLRCEDTPKLRALAVALNERGNSSLFGGVPVPILVVLGNSDTRESYCRRLQALIAELRH